jgi:hypothetical protein
MDYRALILIAVVSATPAVAQTRVGPSVTFDATVGKGTGRTDGLYKDNRSGFAADAVLVMRIKSLPRGSLVAGVNGSVHGAGSHTDICLPAPDGRCIPAFPEFEMLGALLGWQDANAYLRATAGAAYVQAEWEGWSVAWQGRADLALPMASHFGAVLSLRATVIPNYPRGDAFRLFAFGLGLRIF